MKTMPVMVLGVTFFCLSVVSGFADEGRALVEKTCVKCHDLGRVERAFGVKDQEAWAATVTRMLAKPNAPAVTQDEHGAIVDWLVGQKK